MLIQGFPGSSDVKVSACNAGDLGLIPESGKSPGMATHSSILAQRIPWMEELVGYSPWGCKESDMTERLHFSFLSSFSVYWEFLHER